MACKTHCDVVIFGAGPAGSGTALALAASGVEKVVVLDHPPSRSLRVGEAASPDLTYWLRKLGLTPELERFGHVPYHGSLSCWGSEDVTAQDFLLHGKGHGFRLERAAFDRWLQAEASARGVRFCSAIVGSTTVRSAPLRTAEGWLVNTSRGETLLARVLVDATGRRAGIATCFGVPRERVDRLVAIVAHAEQTTAPSGSSLVESFAEGWWYGARLPDGRAVVMLMTDSDVARASRLRDPEVFLAQWRRSKLLAEHVPAPRALTRLDVFDASTGFLRRAVGRSWVAVGDALMALDPLTASGITCALGDAVAAAPTIRGLLLGDLEPATAYARRANAALSRYAVQRHAYYGLERRFDGPFWARRRGNAASSRSTPSVSSASFKQA